MTRHPHINIGEGESSFTVTFNGSEECIDLMKREGGRYLINIHRKYTGDIDRIEHPERYIKEDCGCGGKIEDGS